MKKRSVWKRNEGHFSSLIKNGEAGKAIKDGSWKNGKTARTSTDGTGWRRIAKNGREFSSLSSFVVVATIWGTTTGETKRGSFLDDDDDHNGVRSVKPLRITGEAYLNQRKGKIIPGYELELSIDYELEGERVGTMVLPYVSDENRGEDTEVKFSPKDESEKAEEGEAMDRREEREGESARGGEKMGGGNGERDAGFGREDVGREW